MLCGEPLIAVPMGRLLGSAPMPPADGDPAMEMLEFRRAVYPRPATRPAPVAAYGWMTPGPTRTCLEFNYFPN